MSEPVAEMAPTLNQNSQDLSNFFTSKEKGKFTGILEISNGFPLNSRMHLGQIAEKLFIKGVYRVPIIGFKTESGLEIMALITNQKPQEHKEMMSDLEPKGYKKEQVSFSTSIECGGGGNFIMHLNQDPQEEVAFGRGSEMRLPQFTQEGRKAMEKIFDGTIEIR